nr:golgin subfamily A member 6A-like isoform X4 [Macaca fascicularis]
MLAPGPPFPTTHPPTPEVQRNLVPAAVNPDVMIFLPTLFDVLELAAVFGQLKEYQQRSSPGVPARAKTKKKTTGSSSETTTSGGCHSPGDDLESRYQELEVALDSSSATINQLNENIESLKQQKEQVEHQLEEVTRFLCLHTT